MQFIHANPSIAAHTLSMTHIINAHVHMIEMTALGGNESFLPEGISVYEHVEAAISTLKVETLIDQMDEAGIEQSVLFAVDAPIVYASNEYVKQLMDRYPNRFIGFASVSPQKKNAIETLEHAILKLGLKGLKLHPPLQQFYPNDKRVYPIYEKAQELDIPVVVHVGTTPFGDKCRLSMANPLLMDDVACDFPNLRIMLTHLGTLFHNEAFMVVEKHPNVFIDTAAYTYEIPQILDINLIKRIGRHKIIFGTDYPSPFAEELHNMKAFVDVIRGIGLPADIERDIFHDNFQRLLTGEDHKKVPSPMEILNKLHQEDTK